MSSGGASNDAGSRILEGFVGDSKEERVAVVNPGGKTVDKDCSGKLQLDRGG